MKKLCLFFLSIFMLMSMSWAGVKVSGVVHCGTNKYLTGGTEVIVKLVPASGDALTATYGATADGTTFEFANVDSDTYTLKVEGRHLDRGAFSNNGGYVLYTKEVEVVVPTEDKDCGTVVAEASTTHFLFAVKVVKKESTYTGIKDAKVKVWSGDTEPDESAANTATANNDGLALLIMEYAEGVTSYNAKVTATGRKAETKAFPIAEVVAKAETTNVLTGKLNTVQLQEDLGDLVTLSCTLKEGETTLTDLPSEVKNNSNGKLVVKDKNNKMHDATLKSGKFEFTEVAVGAVTFYLSTGYTEADVAKCWGVKTEGTSATISGANGATVEGTIVLERTAAMVSGKVALSDGTGLNYANVVATKGTAAAAVTINNQTNSQGEYTLYGLSAGEWALSIQKSGYAASEDKTVTIANASDDKTNVNITAVAADMDLTISLKAAVRDADYNYTQLWGTKIKLTKNGAAFGENEYTLPAAATDEIYNAELSITNLKAKIGDKIVAVYNHPDYEPVTREQTIETSGYLSDLEASGDETMWVRKSVTPTLTAYRVDNALAVWESADATATPAVKAGVKLTWAYPAALLDNYANYSVQKIEIERIKYSENNAREVIAYWPKTGNLNDKNNLPTSYKDEAALENGYYGYKISVRYATPSATKDTTVVYGVMPLKVKDLTATYLKEGDKHTATITWDYPAELGTGFGTTYKLQRIELRRRDLSTAADVAVLAVDSIKKADGTAKAFAELLKTYKDEGLVANGSYTYLVEIRYEKPVGTTTEYVVLDLAPVAPINAVAVWNNSTNKMDLSWGYPASLAANWATLQPQKLDIERKDLSSQAAPVSVYSYAVGQDDTYETLPREYSDATASKTGNYKYIFTLRFKDKPACSTEVSPAKRPHRAIDLDAVWTPASGSQGAGVKLTWSYPLELLQTLGTTYKMQHMSLERRDAATPADIITLAAWQKEQLATADALPRTFFDNTALSNGNYNYVITIRYEEPVATVETVKNLNMNLSGVQEPAAAWTAATGGKKAGMKLTWDYTADLRNGLGSAYKLEKLDIVRRDLSTAYDYTTVATYMFMTVSHTEEGGQTTTIDYMTDQSKLPVEFLDTLGATNTGNYSYLFTLRYASPKGQAEVKIVKDQREVVTLSYSVNDATLGEITGSPVSSTERGVTYRKGDLITLKASVKEGADASARFVEWKNGDVRVSTEAEYAFNIMENTTLVAVFAKDAPAVEPLKLINTAATWNTATEKVDLSWDYPQAVKDGLGTTYKIQKIDIERIDAALGASSKTMVKYFTSFTTAANLPTKWEDGEVEKGKTYNYTFTIRYESPVGAPDTTVTVTIPGEQANEDVEAASWSVYSHNGVIEMTGVEGAYTYMVYDLNGRVVAKGQYTGNSHSVRVENKGMYIVRRVSMNGVSAKKVMVM